MRNILARCVGAAGLIVTCLGAHEAAASQSFMHTSGPTSQPIGHYEFCKARPDECNEHFGSTPPEALTDSRWRQLIGINDSVNTSIAPVSDMDLYGKPEVWAYPTTKGDCEDYVLLKRRILAQNGWPLADLLITIVRRANGEGHAVLTVRTDRGDLVLDNLKSNVLVWSDTDYQFVKRQSEADTSHWVAIQDDRDFLVGSVRQ